MGRLRAFDNLIFRRTRSGTEFSPYLHDLGDAIVVNTKYVLDDHLRQTLEDAQALAADDADAHSDHEHAARPDSPLSDLGEDDGWPLELTIDEDFLEPKDKTSKSTKKKTGKRNKSDARVLQEKLKSDIKRGKIRPSPQEPKTITKTRARNAMAFRINIRRKGPEDATPAEGAYVGGHAKIPDEIESRIHADDEVEALGLRGVDWDGRTPRPIVDVHGRIVAILIGRPRAREWDGVVKRAGEFIEAARRRMRPVEDQGHRRGDYACIHCGISFGGGQTAPCNKANTRRDAQIARDLCEATPIRRIAGFANAAVQVYAPTLYDYLRGILDKLLQKKEYAHLRENFEGSAFPMCTFNLGPHTVTLPHRDGANLAAGWCTITALGNFDCKKGGRLILWEFGLAIRFPAGSTIAIPSAVVTHSNTAIQPGETRSSMTQYFAGHLCRFVENGCITDVDLQAGKGKESWEQVVGRRRTWQQWLEMFAKVKDFLQ